MDFPQRKPNRLNGYDYASCGGYFITICTKNRERLFWADETGTELSPSGAIVDQTIREIPNHYAGIRLDCYVVMPNHIHMILIIESETDDGPSISTVVNQMKGAATKRMGKSVWQKLFHDRIIRNEAEYRKIWNYIDTNPTKWKEDCFYCE